MGFISGAGISSTLRGTVSHEILHVTDWYPTIAEGIAGLNLEKIGRPCVNPSRPLVPLDGVNQWPVFSSGAASARNEVLLDLQATALWGATTTIPGMGALRQGRWKILHGHTATWKKINATAATCTMRDGTTCSASSLKCALDITAETSPAWCPNGWVPAPARGRPTVPIPPPDAGCVGIEKGIPCTLRNDSSYLVGGTWLFDVVSDPFEEHDVAATNPSIVSKLLAALQNYNQTHCNGGRCVPDQDTSKRPRGTPTSFGDTAVWIPWDGDPNPHACDTNRTRGRSAPSPGGEIGSFDKIEGLGGEICHATGWTSGPAFSGPSLLVQMLIDSKPFGGLHNASIPRKLAGPHGFDINFPCALISNGKHIVEVTAQKTVSGPVTWDEHVCLASGSIVPCDDPSHL
eukprot:SAG31_NODE_580_length_13940_cov_16.175349_2_plen_403_part_00